MIRGFFSNKNVLVAGSAGFVGTNLVNRLAREGANVFGTIYCKSPQHRNPKCKYVRCDLTNKNDCLQVTKNMSYVFMAAANSSGAGVMASTPLVHLTSNVVMNSYMLEASYENKVDKFCFISSNTVYPNCEYAVKESDAMYDFFDKYFVVGWMKTFSEIMCRMYAEKVQVPMQIIVVRPGNLFGPFDKYTWNESKVIAALIRRAVEKQNPFVVWGNGKDIKDFLYINDFIDGLILAFTKTSGFTTLNIASGIPITIQDVLGTILELSGHVNTQIHFDCSQPTMIPIRKIDISTIQNLTGWKPSTSLFDGIKESIQWYRSTFSHKTPEEAMK